MISSVVSSFDRSWQHTTQSIFLFLSSCLTQGDSSFHEGMNVLFFLSFIASTSIFLKSWFLNKIGASRSWQWQSCQKALSRWLRCRAGWRQQRLTTVQYICFQDRPNQDGELLNLLSQCDFLPTLGHQAAVTVNVHNPLTSSPVSDWPSSCQLKLCCECHTYSY